MIWAPFPAIRCVSLKSELVLANSPSAASGKRLDGVSWNPYAIEKGVDLAVGIKKSRIASKLHDFANNYNVLADIRVEHIGRNARCRHGFHCASIRPVQHL